MNPRRAIAAASGIYDALIGVLMLAGRPLMAQIFSVALPQPPIHADLNGVFLLSVAAGYLIPYREPNSSAGRVYLWVMGPALKGAGAVTFLIDYFVRHSPASFLLFALSDGTMALLTLWALTRGDAPSTSRPAVPQP